MLKLKRALALLLLALLVTAWIPSRTLAATNTTPVRYPVIFVPGIAGSELYNDRELVWINTWRLLGSQLPVLNLFQMQWLLPLRLAADGVTPAKPSYHVHVGDVMRHGLTDAYSGMIQSLKDQGYVEGKDLRLFPYDWRQDPAVTAAQLGRLVDQTLKETGAGKVVLLSHSMGGLVARDYVVHGGAPKVKAMMALATPWLGAPVAYRALQYGWDLGSKVPGTRWALMAPQDVKLLTQNYASVYALVPGRHYYDQYPGGYITRDGVTYGFGAAVERALAPHNAPLARGHAGYVDSLLDGSDHGVMQFLLAGDGDQTPAGFTERHGFLGVMTKTERFADGDEVVPLHSADLGYSKDPAKAQSYLGKLSGVAYVHRQAHTLIAQSPDVQAAVKGWLAQVNH